MRAIWHDLECGSYTEDLAFWRALADRRGGPVLDVGAGTGRVALELARAGHSVVAIDLYDDLLEELRRRAEGLDVTTIVADARSFWLGIEVPLCIAPMQTIQLMGGADGRAGFLECAQFHLGEGGVLAVAIADLAPHAATMSMAARTSGAWSVLSCSASSSRVRLPLGI